jgi:tetrahydromethanopterin S-methyltransferase subunit B
MENKIIENEIIKSMEIINEEIYKLQMLVDTYTMQGMDINEFKPFMTNYPFNASFDEIGEWGRED